MNEIDKYFTMLHTNDFDQFKLASTVVLSYFNFKNSVHEMEIKRINAKLKELEEKLMEELNSLYADDYRQLNIIIFEISQMLEGLNYEN